MKIILHRTRKSKDPGSITSNSITLETKHRERSRDRGAIYPIKPRESRKERIFIPWQMATQPDFVFYRKRRMEGGGGDRGAIL